MQSGSEQARNFLGALAAVHGDGLPPAIDLEFDGNCGNRPSIEEFATRLNAFFDALGNMDICPPVLYVTQEFYSAYITEKFQSKQLWIRDIFKTPKQKDRSAWTLWQFANRGHLPGVATFVDLNVFNGSTQRFSTFRCSAAQ